MRHSLRVLLFVSAIGLAMSVFPTVGGASSMSPKLTTGSSLASITDTRVCGMVTAGEVYRLLNYLASTGPGTPQPLINGGACAWGTGLGEAFEVTVVPRTAGPPTNPCARFQGTEVRASGWIGCSRLELGPNNVLRAFKGHYVVTLEPLENIIGLPYLLAEEATITHVFHELGT